MRRRAARGAREDVVSRKVWTGLAVLALAGAVAYLVAAASTAWSAYYLTIPEAQARAGSLNGRPVRVQGVVDGSSVRWDMGKLELAFAIRDPSDPARTLDVRYRGVRPDGLDGGRTVIVEGVLTPDGRGMEARTVMVQCPSRYEAEVSRL